MISIILKATITTHMGFLTVNGHLMTYDEYKELIMLYKKHGIDQFCKLFRKHKDVQIDAADLHWGEEIEYHMYSFDDQNKEVKLSCDADDILTDFAAQQDLLAEFDADKEESKDDSIDSKPDFKLMPEFGNWMIEAVPAEPYGAYSDPDQLLSCRKRIDER